MRRNDVLFWTEMEFDANISTLTYESSPQPQDDFPCTHEPVNILGKTYSTIYDMEELKADILSRIWFTYRKNFPAIGGSGLISDTGWGCMLRCGQMMLAHALCLRHLGRDWRWSVGCRDEKYWKLLHMFQDKKACVYSIHQIASMGESEGKSVGQWFGPNTIAQVLKRIVVYDEWSNVAIHVALDNTVIEDDIRELCCNCGTSEQTTAAVNGDGFDVPRPIIAETKYSHFVNDVSLWGQGAEGQRQSHRDSVSKASEMTSQKSITSWRPLLLIVPLRLGLTDINPVYFDALKKCLSLPLSVGIIGGKPNHAHWFIGFVGEELVYLDPHTTQIASDLDNPEERLELDETYHCSFPGRMRMNRLDPSVAVGFYCDTEKDFNELCRSLREFSQSNKHAMFEIRKDRPSHLKYQFHTISSSSHSGFQVLGAEAEGSSVDEEEFEML